MKYTITIEHDPLNDFPYTATCGHLLRCGKTPEEAEMRIVEAIKAGHIKEPTRIKEIEI